jgi:hypothetical protein
MRPTPGDHYRHSMIALAALMLAAALVTGCGKASSAKTAATTATTHAQLVAKADAICAKTARTIDPLINQMTAIQHAGGSAKQLRLRTGPLLEEIAGGNRLDARLIMELPVQNMTERVSLQNAAYTMLELSVMEEQLAQGLRTNEPSRIAAIMPSVRQTRAHRLQQAREFGLSTCAQAPQAQIP